MRDITAEIDRENRIITDLLTLVKSGQEICRSSDQSYGYQSASGGYSQTSASDRGQTHIDLILDSFRPVEADVDELKFTSAISNLVEMR